MNRTGRGVGWILFDVKQECGARQDEAKGALNAGFEAFAGAGVPPGLVEAERSLEVGVGHRPPERPLLQCRDDLLRAGNFIAGTGGAAKKDPAAAARIA